MDRLARDHLTRRRDSAARNAAASRRAIAAILAHNDDHTTASDWATIARTAAEGAHYAAQAEAFNVVLDAVPEE